MGLNHGLEIIFPIFTTPLIFLALETITKQYPLYTAHPLYVHVKALPRRLQFSALYNYCSGVKLATDLQLQRDEWTSLFGLFRQDFIFIGKIGPSILLRVNIIRNGVGSNPAVATIFFPFQSPYIYNDLTLIQKCNKISDIDLGQHQVISIRYEWIVIVEISVTNNCGIYLSFQ